MAERSVIIRNFCAFLRHRSAVTIPEIVIVAALSCIVLTSASLIMSRTGRIFKKSSDLLNVQASLESIVERIREDVMNLTRVTKWNSRELEFFSKVKNKEVKISIAFDPEKKTLLRTESGANGETKVFDFRSAGSVPIAVFAVQENSQGEFQSVDFALQVRSHEKGEGRETFLPFSCRFFSKCTSQFNPFEGGASK